MDKPQAMFNACGALMPRIIGHAPLCLGGLPRLDQRAMSAFFAPEDSVTAIIVQGVDGRRMGTAPICGDDAREMRGILAHLGHEALGGMALTIVLLCALVCDPRFGHQGNHCTLVRMPERGTSPRMARGGRPVAVVLCETRLTRKGCGGKIPRAIQGKHRVPLETHPLCKRFTPLQWSKDARERRPQRCGRNRIKPLSPGGVARGTRHAVDRLHVAFGALLWLLWRLVRTSFATPGHILASDESSVV